MMFSRSASRKETRTTVGTKTSLPNPSNLSDENQLCACLCVFCCRFLFFSAFYLLPSIFIGLPPTPNTAFAHPSLPPSFRSPLSPSLICSLSVPFLSVVLVPPISSSSGFPLLFFLHHLRVLLQGSVSPQAPSGEGETHFQYHDLETFARFLPRLDYLSSSGLGPVSKGRCRRRWSAPLDGGPRRNR